MQNLTKKIASRGFTLIELLVVIAIIGILAAIVLASLGTARSKGNDAKVKEQLNSMRNAMEVYYASNNSYGTGAATNGCVAAGSNPSVAPWNDPASGMNQLADGDNYPSGTTLTCFTTTPATGATWAASASLSTSGTYWCVDSTGVSKQTAAVVSTPANGTTAVACP